MANNTRQAVAEAKRRYQKNKDIYMSLFSLLFHNCVDIKNLPKEIPKRYLLDTLLKFGAIAYDPRTRLFLRFVYGEIDVYGLPQRYQLYGYNGYNVWRNADEVVILRANDILFPLYDYFEDKANKLADLDVAINQNLDGIKTTSIIRVSDKSTLLTLANINEARQIGASLIFADKNIVTGIFDKEDTGVEYLVDKLLENRRVILNETLSAIGIAVANTEKRERVQEIEVLASTGFAKDMLKTLCDTVNYDIKNGIEMLSEDILKDETLVNNIIEDLNFRFIPNTSLFNMKQGEVNNEE